MTFKRFFSAQNRRLHAVAVVGLLIVLLTLTLGAWGGKKKSKLAVELPREDQAAEPEESAKSPAQKAREARAEKAAVEKAAKAEKQAAKQAEKEARKNAAKAGKKGSQGNEAEPSSAANPPAPANPTPPSAETNPKAPEEKQQTPKPPKKKSILDWFTSSKSTYEEVDDALKEAEKDLAKKKYVDATTLAARAVSKIREQELDRNGSEDATAERYREAIKRAESIAERAGKRLETTKVPAFKATYVEL